MAAESSGGRFGKLTTLVRRFGWKRSLTAVTLWGLRQAVGYRSAVIFRLDLAKTRPDAPCRQFTWNFTAAGEVARALWNAADIQELEADTRCFVGRSNQEQCYLSLVSGRGFAIPGRVSVSFSGPTEAYVGNCLTLDRYRGMGIYPCGLSELGARLQTEGVRWLYLFVERENLASIRGVEKAGFRPVAACSVFQWRGRPRQGFRILSAAEDPELVRRWQIKR